MSGKQRQLRMTEFTGYGPWPWPQHQRIDEILTRWEDPWYFGTREQMRWDTAHLKAWFSAHDFASVSKRVSPCQRYIADVAAHHAQLVRLLLRRFSLLTDRRIPKRLRQLAHGRYQVMSFFYNTTGRIPVILFIMESATSHLKHSDEVPCVHLLHYTANLTAGMWDAMYVSAMWLASRTVLLGLSLKASGSVLHEWSRHPLFDRQVLRLLLRFAQPRTAEARYRFNVQTQSALGFVMI